MGKWLQRWQHAQSSFAFSCHHMNGAPRRVSCAEEMPGADSCRGLCDSVEFDGPPRADPCGHGPCTAVVWTMWLGMCSPFRSSRLLGAGGSAACDDGTLCTEGDVCTNGACVGQPTTCDDGVDCTTDSCDPDFGCVFTPDGGVCDDGDPCTTDECDAQNGCANEPVDETPQSVGFDVTVTPGYEAFLAFYGGPFTAFAGKGLSSRMGPGEVLCSRISAPSMHGWNTILMSRTGREKSPVN